MYHDHGHPAQPAPGHTYDEIYDVGHNHNHQHVHEPPPPYHKHHRRSHHHHHHHRHGLCRSRPICYAMAAILALLTLAAIGVGVYFALMAKKDYSSGKDVDVCGRAQIVSWQYDGAMMNHYSADFRQKEGQFCHEVTQLLESTIGADIEKCRVKSFSNSYPMSVTVEFTLTIEVPGGAGNTEYIQKVKEQIHCGLSDPLHPGYMQILADRSTITFTDCMTGSYLQQGACMSTETCERYLNAYRCKCPDGYHTPAPGGACVDINECDTNNGWCEDKCINNIGSYHCECPFGQTLLDNGHGCKAIQDCEDKPCSVNSQCVDLDVGYQCHCNFGYTGEDCMIKKCDTDEGWVFYNDMDSGSCYKFFPSDNQIQDQADAEAACIAETGNLVSINDDDELAFVSALLDDNGVYTAADGNPTMLVWTGLLFQAGTFGDATAYRWTDGSSSGDSVNWRPGATEPVPANVGDDLCAYMRREEWNSVTRRRDYFTPSLCTSSTAMQFVCEKNVQTTRK